MKLGICNLYNISINKVYVYAVLYTVHMISQNIDGGATEADGGASAPVGPSVAMPLVNCLNKAHPSIFSPVNKLRYTVLQSISVDHVMLLIM